jgi:chemotaxis signal transduction protein
VSDALAGNDRAAGLRRAFDAQFAERPAVRAADLEDFLLVGVSGLPYALRLSEIAGVAKSPTLCAVPTRRRELLGLTGIRGKAVCVYGLAAVLGLPETGGPEAWLALGPGDDVVAVAFERLDGFVRVAASNTVDAAGGEQPLVRGVLRGDAMARPIVDLGRVFALARRSSEPPAERGEG